MWQKCDARPDLTSKEILANPAFQYMKTIDDISQSFLKNMDLHFFGHVTAYPTGEFSFLCNKHGWAEEIFVEEKLPPIGFVFYDQLADGVVFPNMDKSNIFGWSDEVTVNSRDQFNILNPMLIMQKYDDHFEGFVFDIHSKNAYEKYVGNFDIFEQFMHYYKESAKKMLTHVRQQPLQVARQYLRHDLHKQNTPPGFNHGFSVSPAIKRYYLKRGNHDVVLSKKEYDCLSLLAHGVQLKFIADELNISLRTVETYLERLKKKLNILSRNELVTVYWKNRILSEKIPGIFS